VRRTPLLIAGAVALAATTAAALLFHGDPPAATRPQPGRARGHRPVNLRGEWSLARALGGSPTEEPEQAEHPRIVALAPAAAQIARDLELGHLLVGRHASDRWSDQRLPVCGEQFAIDYERLIAAEPTHIFLQRADRDDRGNDLLPQRLRSLARERGWTVVNLQLVSLQDVRDAVLTVHDRVAPAELRALRWEAAHTYADPQAARPGLSPDPRAERIRNAPSPLLHDFDAAMTNPEPLAGAGRILLLYQGEGESGVASLAALGPGSYHHDILAGLGAVPAITSGKIFMQLDLEDISRLKPDGIILIRPRSGPDSSAAQADGRSPAAAFTALAGLDIPAVRERKVGVIDDPMALVPGTNLTAVAERMRRILRAWAAAGAPATRGAAPADQR